MANTKVKVIKTSKTTISVVRTIPERTEAITLRVTLKGTPIRPRCPDCGGSVVRDKCMFELGDGCGRWDLYNAYRDAMDAKGLKVK